ncbi:MAG: hypothetical protein ACOYED_04235, partial [Peptococcia bacterium]
VTGLKQDVTGLKQDVTGLKQDVTGLKQDVTGLKQDVTELKDRVTKIEIKLENDVAQKISVLFDGWQQHNDQLDRIEAKVSRHEELIVKRVK